MASLPLSTWIRFDTNPFSFLSASIISAASMPLMYFPTQMAWQ
jgi:hypothetical protein